MSIKVSQLSEATNCDAFSLFDCHYIDDYTIAPHLEKEICDLCTYLSQRALYAYTKGYSVSYIAYDGNNVAGFFTISAGHIVFDNAERNKIHDLEELNKKDYKTFPAVKIVQLAVQSEYQGRTDEKIGDQLIEAIEIIAHHLSKNIGIRFLKVDALADHRTVKFYTRMGFKPQYDTKTISKYTELLVGKYQGMDLSVPMYLDLHKTKR